MSRGRVKYYLAQIDERHSDYEVATTILIQAKHNDDAYDVLDRIAQRWRGEHEGEEDEGEYWFDGSLVSAGSYDSINKMTFDYLSTHTMLNDLTHEGEV